MIWEKYVDWNREDIYLLVVLSNMSNAHVPIVGIFNACVHGWSASDGFIFKKIIIIEILYRNKFRKTKFY